MPMDLNPRECPDCGASLSVVHFMYFCTGEHKYWKPGVRGNLIRMNMTSFNRSSHDATFRPASQHEHGGRNDYHS